MKTRYFVFINHTIKGPFTSEEIKKLPYFKPDILISREDELGWWKEAEKFEEFSFKNYYIEENDYNLKKDFNINILNSVIQRQVLKIEELKEKLSQKELEIREKEFNFKEIMSQKDEKIKFLEEKIKKLENELLEKNKNEEWEKLYFDLKRKFYQTTTKYEEKIKEKENEIKRKIIEKNGILTRFNIKKKEIEINYKSKVSSLEEQIKKISSELYEKDLIISKLNLLNKTLNDKINDLKKIIIEDEKEKLQTIKKLNDEIIGLEERLNNEKEKNTKLEDELNKIKERLKEIEEINNLKDKKESELKEILIEKINTLKKYLYRILPENR